MSTIRELTQRIQPPAERGTPAPPRPSREVNVLPLDGRQLGFRARARELSSRGIFVYSERRLELGTLVVVQIRPGAGLPALAVTAEVVHHLPGRGLGCRFVDLDPETRSRLQTLAAALERRC